MLHHLDVQRSVARIFELLRPGGTIAFAEPNMLNPQIFLERRFCHLPIFSHVSPDETAFVRWTLAALLEKAGFTGITIRPHDWLHPATPRPFIGAVRRLGAALERTPLVRELSGSHLILARRPM